MKPENAYRCNKNLDDLLHCLRVQKELKGYTLDAHWLSHVPTFGKPGEEVVGSISFDASRMLIKDETGKFKIIDR